MLIYEFVIFLQIELVKFNLWVKSEFHRLKSLTVIVSLELHAFGNKVFEVLYKVKLLNILRYEK